MTSKIDDPPPYEVAVQAPRYGNYAPEAQHGSPLAPPPAYTPSPGMHPGMHGGWGQQTDYPQAGMWAAPGFLMGTAATTIPTLSAGVDTSIPGDVDDFLSSQWESPSIRHAFIRKVYFILAAQLAVTFSVVSVFTFVDPVRLFVIKYRGIYWASLVVYFGVYSGLICCEKLRRRFPWNFVLLGVFTVALSYMCGAISSYYETKAVFLAMGMTTVVCIAVTIFCFQTKVDFTSCGGVLSIAAVLFMIIGIVTAVVLYFQYVPWLHMLYAAIGAIIYTLFLVYNTQLLIGNRERAISPEEYIYGALSLYVDTVHVFLCILQMSGAASSMNNEGWSTCCHQRVDSGGV